MGLTRVFSTIVMINSTLACHNCGQVVRLLPRQRIGRQDICDSCDADLHCCRNCRFLDPGKSNQCSEPQAEWVSDKNRSNFCDYFEPRTSVPSTIRPGDQQKGAKDQFEALFNKKS